MPTALAACTMNADHPVPGWPELTVIEHRVPHEEINARCARYVGFGVLPIACAEFNFKAGTCNLWFSADLPLPQAVLRHEREHCAGYDHEGESTLARLLEAHRRAP